MQHLDVSDCSELPEAPAGFRYLDFLSEPKGFRCFLIPRDMPRGEFLEKHSHLLDERLQPIYQHDGITVRQDSSFPIPGFYIVHPKIAGSSFDEINETLHLRTSFVMREIRKGMREALGIEHIHLYYEEKRKRGFDIHYWLLPIYNFRVDKDYISAFFLREYLDSFDFQVEKEKILHFNNLMKNYLHKVNLLSRDKQLSETLTHAFICASN